MQHPVTISTFLTTDKLQFYSLLIKLINCDVLVNLIVGNTSLLVEKGQ